MPLSHDTLPLWDPYILHPTTLPASYPLTLRLPPALWLVASQPASHAEGRVEE